MKTLFKNLKLRLLTTLFFILCALFYGFGYIIVYTLEENHKKNIEASLFTVLKDSKHDFNQNLDTNISFEEIKEEFDIPLLYAQIVAYDTLSKQPKILSRSFDLMDESLPITNFMMQDSIKKPHDIIFSITPNTKLSHHKLYVGTMFLAQNEFQMLFLQCAIPYNKHTSQSKELTSILWIGLSCLLIIILFLAYRLIQTSFLHVKSINQMARALQGKTKNIIISKTFVANEIDDLIDTFNTLLQELQLAYTQVKQFGQNASHELKTPLTIIQGELEVGLRKNRSLEEYQIIMKKISHEVNNLHTIIDKILFLSSNTQQEIQTYFSEIYMDEIVLEALEDIHLFAQSKQIKCHIDTLEAQSIYGHSGLLKIAITNLLDNALKYSPVSSEITLSLYKHRLVIQDRGIGIPPEDLEHVFQQFYRGSEGKKIAQGSGLGLSLVNTIVNLHGFKLHIQSIPQKGTSVILLF